MHTLSTLFSLLEALMPVIVGALASWVFGMIKVRVVPAIGQAPALLQQMVFTLFATLVVFAGSWLGLPLPGDPGQWDVATVNAVLTALSGFGIHAVKKAVKAGL